MKDDELSELQKRHLELLATNEKYAAIYAEMEDVINRKTVFEEGAISDSVDDPEEACRVIFDHIKSKWRYEEGIAAMWMRGEIGRLERSGGILKNAHYTPGFDCEPDYVGGRGKNVGTAGPKIGNVNHHGLKRLKAQINRIKRAGKQ